MTLSSQCSSTERRALPHPFYSRIRLVREGMLEARREAQLKEDHGEASPHGIDNGATAKKSVPSSSSVYNVFGRCALG